MLTTVIVPAAAINLAGGFSTFWNAIVAGFGGSRLTTMLTTIGVIILVCAIGKWLWDRRRGGGGSSQGLWGALIIGSVLAAPAILLPLLLTILDFVANSVLKLVQAIT